MHKSMENRSPDHLPSDFYGVNKVCTYIFLENIGKHEENAAFPPLCRPQKPCTNAPEPPRQSSEPPSKRFRAPRKFPRAPRSVSEAPKTAAKRRLEGSGAPRSCQSGWFPAASSWFSSDAMLFSHAFEKLSKTQRKCCEIHENYSMKNAEK